MHIFPYSQRKGTVAEKLPQVDSKAKTARAKTLGELNEQNFLSYRKKYCGKTEEILIEEVKGEYAIGHTKNYIKCFVENKPNITDVGRTLKVKLTKPLFDGCAAKTLDK